ncbi:serine hydrolase [Streptomyces cirratus]
MAEADAPETVLAVGERGGTAAEVEADEEAEGESEASTDAEAEAGTGLEVATEIGSVDGALAEAAARSEAGTEAGETAPGAPAALPDAIATCGAVPGTAAAEGDVPASGAEANDGAASARSAAATGEPAPGTERTAASDGDAPASKTAVGGPASEAEAGAEGTSGSVSAPRVADADGDVTKSDAVADGGGTPQAEVGGRDVRLAAPEPAVGADGVDGAGTVDEQDEAAEESAEAAGPDDDAGREDRPVPSWARDDEADAERTSQFVALKDLDAPTEKARLPRVVPPNPAPGRTSATPTTRPGIPAPAPGRTPTPGPAPAASPGAGRASARPGGPARTPAGTAEPAATPAPEGPAPHPVVERTREVPVPPRPPLDLLAELTNNPPPPETPRRTVVRRVKIWTPILLLLAGAAIGGQLLRPLPAPRVVAAEQTHTLGGQFSVPWPAKGQGAVRVPGSGDIGAFGEQKPVPTASVAKVMTAYVILKNHPLRKTEAGPQIEVDAKAVTDGTSDDESRIEGFVAGAKFGQQDMLRMLMLKSANNVARLLARWDTGTDSESAFVGKMNAAARELGMRNTTYTDPSGLDAGTVSTAADQLKLAEAVMKDEAFRAVVALPSAGIKGLSETLINNNTLLTVNGLSVRGIKTGSNTPAGGTLMWAAYKSVGDETPLILGTLMDQHADGPDHNGENSLKLVLANSEKIIGSVRQALDSAPVIRKGQTVGHVDDGLGGRTPLVATKDLSVIGVPGQQLQLALRPGASGTPHAAKAGTEVGVLTVGTGEGAKYVPVALGTRLAEPSFTSRVTRLR